MKMKKNSWLPWVIIAVVGVLFLWLIIAIPMIVGGYSDQLETLGTASELLTALFSAAAFVAVVVTLSMQRDELSLTRKEFKAQREEFEKMAQAQNNLLEVERSKYMLDSKIYFTNHQGFEPVLCVLVSETSHLIREVFIVNPLAPTRGINTFRQQLDPGEEVRLRLGSEDQLDHDHYIYYETMVGQPRRVTIWRSADESTHNVDVPISKNELRVVLDRMKKVVGS